MNEFSFLLAAFMLTGLVAIALGITTYLLIGFLKTINERVELSLKIMSHNLKTLKFYGRGIDDLKIDSQKIISSQTKAFDYQNVLINSLNRQLRNLDAILSDGRQIAKSNSKPVFAPSKSPIQKLAPAKNGPSQSPTKYHKNSLSSEGGERSASLANNSVILLDKLLAVKRLSKDKHSNGREKIAKLSSMFERASSSYVSDQNMTERKISNG